MNIVGLSEKKIEFLLENHYIDSILSLYRMKNHGNGCGVLPLEGYNSNTGKGPALEDEDGWETKSVDNLLNAIEKSRKCDFISFIHAMGIPNVGKGQAKLLKKHLDDIWPEYEEEMERELSADGAYDLMGLLYLLRVNHDYDFRVINGFGEIINDSLCEWIDTYLVNVSGEDIANESETAWVIELLDELTFMDKKPEKSSSISTISGKTFVITGKVNHYANRDALKEEIENLGGKVSGSVTSKTDFLINNDVESTSGKNKKAKELGVKIISEEEYLQMIGIEV